MVFSVSLKVFIEFIVFCVCHQWVNVLIRRQKLFEWTSIISLDHHRTIFYNVTGSHDFEMLFIFSWVKSGSLCCHCVILNRCQMIRVRTARPWANRGSMVHLTIRQVEEHWWNRVPSPQDLYGKLAKHTTFTIHKFSVYGILSILYIHPKHDPTVGRWSPEDLDLWWMGVVPWQSFGENWLVTGVMATFVARWSLESFKEEPSRPKPTPMQRLRKWTATLTQHGNWEIRKRGGTWWIFKNWTVLSNFCFQV